MVRRSWIPSLVTALVLAVALPAAAQDKPKIAPAQMKKAKEAFERAHAHYQAGRYAEAIKAYEEAYAAAPLPAFHFNFGQAYRLKGDKRKAVEHYKKYLELEPGGEGAVEAQSHLAVLGRELDAEEAAAREKAAAVERERAVEEARRKEREAAQAELAARPLAPPVDTPEKKGGTLKIAGLVTGGAGLVLTGVGIYFGLKASSLSSDLANLEEWDSSIVDEGESANTNMMIFTGLGAAAVVTGGVLYYLGMRADRPAEKLTVVPLVSPSLTGILVRSSW
jgi:tetratricopeptide (TPR) repeat protein